MRGDSESASRNTSNPDFTYLKYSNIRISESSLASDLVFVIVLAVIFTGELSSWRAGELSRDIHRPSIQSWL